MTNDIFNLPDFDIPEAEPVSQPSLRWSLRFDRDGAIRFISPALRAQLGYAPQEDLRLDTILDTASLSFSLTDLLDSLHAGQPFRHILPLRNMQGEVQWQQVSIVARPTDTATEWLAVGRELTEQELTEHLAQPYRLIPRFDPRRWMNIRLGIIAGVIFMLLALAAGGFLGLGGLNHASQAIEHLQQQELSRIQDLSQIKFLIADNRAHLKLATEAEHQTQITRALQQLEQNREQIDTLLNTIETQYPASNPQVYAQFRAARQRYVLEGLQPTREAIAAGNTQQAAQLIRQQVNPLYDEVIPLLDQLIVLSRKDVGMAFLQVQEENQQIITLGSWGLGLGIFWLLLSSLWFDRDTVNPLRTSIRHLQEIARGNLSIQPDFRGYGDAGDINRALFSAQVQLQAIINDITDASEDTHSQCRVLESTLLQIAENVETQHVMLGRVINEIASCVQFSMQAQFTDEEQGGCQCSNAVERLNQVAFTSALDDINRVADALVDNRHELQTAWARSEDVVATAAHLHELVQYFSASQSSQASAEQ